ncbi:hypothetical protein ABL78_2428 [Leptomonas seymouri]|uniref:Uncharacterized protein n=1 Tax=Leptomonas seymouri TaxID=5684 RepID=A0A0N0P772_LEPSE|nr:hypothetical protein ABL78_2428 [Leptomonas seymouri]|eukprot:KPI88466.1 hypothetical protein ABL78_2428 [Leptomonas seymouri]
MLHVYSCWLPAVVQPGDRCFDLRDVHTDASYFSMRCIRYEAATLHGSQINASIPFQFPSRALCAIVAGGGGDGGEAPSSIEHFGNPGGLF